MSARADIAAETWFQGEDKILRFTIVDSAGAAQDLTAFAGISWVLATATGRAAILTKTLGAGVAITDAAGGIVEVTVPAANTATLAARQYAHHLRRTDAAAAAILAHGTIVLEEKIP